MRSLTTVSPAEPVGVARPRRWFAFAAFLVFLTALTATVAYATTRMDRAPEARAFPSRLENPHWLDGWSRWDANWYLDIAERGYSYTPGQQSTVAFFPAYPGAIRLVRPLAGSAPFAGVLVTIACGLLGALMFHEWCRRRMRWRAAHMSLLVLLAYPYSYYLGGAVYSDALFMAATLGAFLLLDDDRVVLAGVVGAVAAAARPVGPVVAAALVLRLLERRGFLGRRPVPPAPHRRLRGGDAAVLLAFTGFAAYVVLLQLRFDDPLAFVHVSNAPGWAHGEGWKTWFKYEFFRLWSDPGLTRVQLNIGLQAVLTIGALAMVPRVIKRFGWAYGLYCLGVVGVPALVSRDFLGMGRYLLAAFPVFALVGERLDRAPWLTVGRRRVPSAALLLAASVVVLVVLTQYYARWYYIS